MCVKRLRVYTDTSFWGGCFDAIFREESRRVVELALNREIDFIFSSVLFEELAPAPPHVLELLESLPEFIYETVSTSRAARFLAEQYMKAHIFPASSRADALHVAVAALASADVIVSWNFKHLANIDCVRNVNSVNVREGFPVIDIRDPREIGRYE